MREHLDCEPMDRWRSRVPPVDDDLGRRVVELLGIKRCEAIWHWLVREVENGYDDMCEEWQNDLDSRLIIERAIDQLPPDLSARLAERVRPWDDRFIEATRAVARPYWHGGWWADRVPKKIGPILSADLANYLDPAEQ